MLEKVKKTLRLTTDIFDDSIEDLIDAALGDLGIAGVDNLDTSDPMVIRAVETYCKLHFGEPEEADRLKRSYDEQKAQLSTNSRYTIWG